LPSPTRAWISSSVSLSPLERASPTTSMIVASVPGRIAHGVSEISADDLRVARSASRSVW
jgi:hypothetical protein